MCLYVYRVCISAESSLGEAEVACRQGLPWSLSIIQSGAALLAIISPVRNPAGPPPQHISLCQLTCCLWIEPWSMKLHATVIITFGDICCFGPRLHRQMSPLILGPRLIKKRNEKATYSGRLLVLCPNSAIFPSVVPPL